MFEVTASVGRFESIIIQSSKRVSASALALTFIREERFSNISISVRLLLIRVAATLGLTSKKNILLDFGTMAEKKL